MTVLGVMSGTSLDGLDLALCSFEKTGESYSFKIESATTIAYSGSWKETLANAQDLNAEKYFRLHHNYGSFIASEINKFIKHVAKPFAVASHGHTVFHQPHLGFTTQIGCGATIAAHTGLVTVSDFRSLDVAKGGQGAPLVPIGDKLLFPEYGACLNIGGIANVSFNANHYQKAYDICFANMALNYLSEKLGKPYDENGELACSGKCNEQLLEEINRAKSPVGKVSLSREQFEKTIIPLLNYSRIPVEDKLATMCAYSGNEIASTLSENNLESVLVTGGGAYNKCLVDSIQNGFKGRLIIPADEIVQFKEALIFAFLGYLRLHGTINTLSSVTGATSDSVSGAVYFNQPV